jgi:formate hydrogenlyase subunit 6/NADH:ubiquinone oxidoreductase subunit I
MLCARRCPAVAITVSREDRTWAIEHLTCIGCNVCVEVCNKSSLSMSTESKGVRTHAEVGPQGQRPGHEEWHGAAPEPAVAKASAA